ncbi:MAG: 23S rRNA (pseudouridine(1915)-N(3))-methyltransferase RlmH [Candidatus Peribacteraceae bacterium]|nr:23S rRNA (pseudouridine(1915)-N(3))-methyltransferase RlmH [Candidatus Peribacteraceae bacterium]
MHRITLVVVGKIKTDWISDGCAEFIKRLDPLCDFEIITLKAGTPQEEHERILQWMEKKNEPCILLDERGKQRTSQEFSQWIGSFRDRGESMNFILGGAYGFSDAIRSQASHKIALSSMTFPHELCQLVFLEQLYRAHMIARGSGYHH